MRLRQWERAHLLLRILRGDDEERHGQRVCRAVARDLVFLHRFEQRALRLRRGAVHLIDQHHLGKERPGVENEALLIAVENGVADDVGRQQVAGELDAAEL